jgi:hypothetical protein
MKNINRRESPRIDIKLRCHVTSPALWMRGSMYTENMSRNGVLVAWRGDGGALPLPQLGQIVTLDVELPAHHGFGPKCIHAQGTVVRVMQREDYPRVALSVNYMDFRTFEDRIHAVESGSAPANSWTA